MPCKQPKRRWLCLNDGRSFRILNIIDEFTRECLAIQVARRLRSMDVIHALGKLFVCKGIPRHIRSDNGSEFIAVKLREWLQKLGVKLDNLLRPTVKQIRLT